MKNKTRGSVTIAIKRGTKFIKSWVFWPIVAKYTANKGYTVIYTAFGVPWVMHLDGQRYWL